MEGLRLMRSEHMVPGQAELKLPYASIPAVIFDRLYEKLTATPKLKPYVPRIEDVDFFLMIDKEAELFVLCVSPSSSSHTPTRGMNLTFLEESRQKGQPVYGALPHCIDNTGSFFINSVFDTHKFERGIGIVGPWKSGFSMDSDESAEQKGRISEEASTLILAWAERRRATVENSKIFLSHKGVNKPLVTKIDAALRLLGLKTWFDQDDLAAGDPLVRSVDNAFASCSAAVFFISGDYVDAGVIGKEIDRAMHEAATRGGGFRIIQLVLEQHGGTDDRVPDPLKTLVWKTVQDIDIVPTILRALPPDTQAMVRYAAPK